MKGISRRRFLAASLAGGAATTLTMSKKAFGAGTFEGYPDSMGVLVDLTRCIGCRSCEAACNKEQGLPEPDRPFDDCRSSTSIGTAGQSGGPRKKPIRWSTGTIPTGGRYSANFSAITAMSRPV